MTAYKLTLKHYAARRTEADKQRARYLRKLTAPVCKVCYGLSHVACSTCPKGAK